jgi:hypothetical protein
MRRTLLATALLLSACMAESAHGPGARAPRTDDEIVCKDEQTTGTAITRRVCRGPEQRKSDEAARQSWMTGWHPDPMRGDFTYPGMDLRHPQQPSSDAAYGSSPPPAPPSSPD